MEACVRGIREGVLRLGRGAFMEMILPLSRVFLGSRRPLELWQ